MSPFDHYRQIRDQVMERGLALRLPRHPFVNIYQPLQALRAVTALPDLHFVKSLAPVISDSGEAPLCQSSCWPVGRFPNLGVSCQLAMLWAILAQRIDDAELRRSASRLSAFLAPILEERLTTLWTPEREDRTEETALSAALLLRSLGKTVSLEPFSSLREEGFFSFLYHGNPQIEVEKEALKDPSLQYELFRSENTAWAITADGWQTSAGAIRIGDVYIPAFGPQAAPLNDPLCFGIGRGSSGWFHSFAEPESWFCLESLSATHPSFLLQSAGISAEKPMAFVFYVRSDECKVQGRVYKPNSLQRFAAEAYELEFAAKETRLSLTIDRPLKTEIIPLAGSSSYWGATFLAAFWLSPFHSKTCLQFQQK